MQTWQEFLSDYYSHELYKKNFCDLTNEEQNRVLDMVSTTKKEVQSKQPGFWENKFHSIKTEL